ncbi:hypothetical protein LguiA_000215 [Lonicera macranthoides]
MSNSIGQNLLHQSLLPSTVREHQSTCIAGKTLFQAQATSHIRKSPLTTKFLGNRLNVRKTTYPMATNRTLSVSPQAVLATDPASQNLFSESSSWLKECLHCALPLSLSNNGNGLLNPGTYLGRKFSLDGNTELQVIVRAPTAGSVLQVDFQVTNSNDNLTLHWGGMRKKKEKWLLPTRRPDGTKVYKDRALRTPLIKSGSNSFLSIEIDDPELQAIEFLIVDEAQNKWFKHNGDNFHIELRLKGKLIPNVSVPEDLVQIQAYVRWERNGKQTYTPEEDKASKSCIMDSHGSSNEDIRARLTNKNELRESKVLPLSEKTSEITDDLVQTQAYIRWEKAGKPQYSADRQLREFEEARKELQTELEKGMSLDDLRKKIMKGEIQTKAPKQQEKKKHVTIERIQRKNRDPMQLLNKHAKVPAKATENTSTISKALSTIELFARAKEEHGDGPIINRKIYKLGDKELLVLVTKPSGKTRVHLATDLNDPATLHWALSKQAGEWLGPPPSILPPGSVSSYKAVETNFSGSSDDPTYKVQSLDIEVDDDTYVGMPFVLFSGGRWMKDNGSDFYVEFGVESKEVQKDFGGGKGKGTAKALLDKIVDMESEAQKSFMHRFNIAADLTKEAKDAGELGLAGILVWMRFMATRQLIWNKNYNVKPRCPSYRELLRMIMSTVGRGGEGDVGQRIRDEILVIQRNNDCKGGMMEEWHQKLHNNTSPDDVVICQALINYIKSDFDISVYWKTLNENGITKERLLSYDRAIHSEPKLSRNQKDGLLRDLGNYMRTLKAVHSGADLESAVSNCMGYKSEGKGFMVGVHINPVSGLPSEFPDLLQFVLQHVEDKNVEGLLEGLLEAREELRPLLSKPNDRLKDLLFLDIALDSTVRTAIERGYEELNNAKPEFQSSKGYLDNSVHAFLQKIMYFITLLLENLALSSDDNEDLIYCLKISAPRNLFGIIGTVARGNMHPAMTVYLEKQGWNQALSKSKSGDHHWALFAKSVLDRTRLALTSKAEWFQQLLQPSAEYLGSQLGVDQRAVNIFTEEIIRAGSAASLSLLLNRLDPILRITANLGSWQVICPVEAVGYVVVVNELLAVQNETYERPTILVAKSVRGEEEIPDGAVAVLTPDMPDVLSHVSVRARNSKVCFATCFDPDILANLQAKQGKLLQLKPTSADVVYSELKEGDLTSSTNEEDSGPLKPLTLVKKQFAGRYAISSEEFTSEMVGAKSRNIAYLKGKVPSSVGIPTSVALPFGVFEKVLSDDLNQGVAKKVQLLQKKLGRGEYSILGEIRKTVLELAAPPKLVEELKSKMQSSGMPWPGDEGKQRWEQAWVAIKKVWASKWNERAYFSTRKVKLDHNFLCMAVLVQEIINADYAFVIHTTNPSSGDSSEIYAEVVKGLGETLVGAYPGRALSFICKKSDLNCPQVLGYPSKPIGLFIRQSIIFRSDSNGEDLEGYAGAGLYDSVPMDKEEKVVLDYSSDPLISDVKFQKSILASIAGAGKAIEDLYGSAQDIEGVVRDGKIYVVQTRPQM